MKKMKIKNLNIFSKLFMLSLIIILISSGCTPTTPNDGNGNGNGNNIIDSYYIEGMEWVELRLVGQDLAPTLLEILHYYGKAENIIDPITITINSLIQDDSNMENPYNAIQFAESYGLEGVMHFLGHSDMKKMIKKDIPILILDKQNPIGSLDQPRDWPECWRIYKGFDDGGTPDPLTNFYTEEKGIFIVDDPQIYPWPDNSYVEEFGIIPWGYGPDWNESYKDASENIPYGGDEHFCLIIYEPGANLYEGLSTIPPEESWFPDAWVENW
jgi:hypothetical protein